MILPISGHFCIGGDVLADYYSVMARISGGQKIGTSGYLYAGVLTDTP